MGWATLQRTRFGKEHDAGELNDGWRSAKAHHVSPPVGDMLEGGSYGCNAGRYISGIGRRRSADHGDLPYAMTWPLRPAYRLSVMEASG
jgi:hypothetical protein